MKKYSNVSYIGKAFRKLIVKKEIGVINVEENSLEEFPIDGIEESGPK